MTVGLFGTLISPHRQNLEAVQAVPPVALNDGDFDRQEFFAKMEEVDIQSLACPPVSAHPPNLKHDIVNVDRSRVSFQHHKQDVELEIGEANDNIATLNSIVFMDQPNPVGIM
jgi:hypothetical protein